MEKTNLTKHDDQHIVTISSKTGGESVKHTFSEEEKESFAGFINSSLKDVPGLEKILPIDTNGIELFTKCADGILLCKLINYAVPDTVDSRVLNTEKLSKYKIIENVNLMINSAKGIGCNVVNIGSSDIMEGNPYLILGLMWQIIRIGLLSHISLREHPELFRLLEEGESLDDLLKLQPEKILLRWVNYHLKNGKSAIKISNFSGDIKNSEVYTIVLTQLNKDCSMKPMKESDLLKRAELMLKNAEIIDCNKFVQPKDVVNGNPKLNLAFVANMFNTCPGLKPLTEEEKAKLDEWLFASEGDRESRTFCLWMNSLGADPFVTNLFLGLTDGIILFQIFDKISPNSVDWSKVIMKPKNKFQTLGNVNYCIEVGKKHRFSLVGTQGSDIYDGNKKLILGLVWQMMRFHVVSVLKKLSKDGKDVSEDMILKWANEKVVGSPIKSFDDSSISDGKYLLELCESIHPGSVDDNLVTSGSKDDEKLLNAKYVISIARKLGATIFLLPEDILDVKPKMILTLIGSLMAVYLSEGVK